MFKLYPTEILVSVNTTHSVDLPSKLITRTFLEADFTLNFINLVSLTTGKTIELTWKIDDIPILGLFSGAVVMHQGWGVIDYRNLSVGLRSDYLSPEGLDLRGIQNGSVCLEIESDSEVVGKIKLWHEVIEP